MAGVVSQASREAVLAWFVEYQRNCVVQNGIVPEWFHGIISRKEAEDMLMIKPPGYFLIRVSESRIGYTLSYKAEDRCRHFMIDMLPGNQYVIVGEKMHHRSLHDLVAFHRRTPILPFVEVLTVACGQVSKDNTNYAELMFPKRQVCPPETNVRASSPRPEPSFTEDPRPALPTCPPFLQQNSGTPISPPGPPTRLYPSLDNELAALKLQDTVPPPKPVPKARTKHIDTPPPLPPPHIPPRSTSPHSTSHSISHSTAAADKKKGLPSAYIERPLPSPLLEDKDNSQKSQAEAKSARISLAQYKKIFQKKKNYSEEHTYLEINEQQIGKEPAFTEPNQQDLGVNSSEPKDKDAPSVETSGALPIEYLNPPPFAPGY